MSISSVQVFLEYILKSLLDEGTEFSISVTQDSMGTLYEVTVPEESMGKVIGKNGQTIQALRTLLRMMGSKTGERVTLKVLEPTHATV